MAGVDEATLEEAPGDGGAPGGSPDQGSRRRKAAVLAAIAALLVAIAAFLIYRALTGETPTPGIVAPEMPSYELSIYGTDDPMGVAVSPSGDRIYVTETSGRRSVRVYDGDGEEIGRLEPPRAGPRRNLPVYVAVSPMNGDVYVSDRLRQTVDIFDSEGEYLKSFTPSGPLGKNANPLGLAFGPDGQLYMTDVKGRGPLHRVLIFDGNSGKTKPVDAIGTRGQFAFPNGLAIDPEGGVYLTDSNNGRLVMFDPEGKATGSIRRGVGEGDLSLPRGVAIDGDDRLYVVDTTAHTIKIYELPDEEGELPEFIGSFGVQGFRDGRFEYPNGIATDADGRIYVTDRENDRVQVWSY